MGSFRLVAVSYTHLFDFCTAQIGYLRADTHADNRPMQRLLEAYGFRRCGVIHGAFDLSLIHI